MPREHVDVHRQPGAHRRHASVWGVSANESGDSTAVRHCRLLYSNLRTSSTQHRLQDWEGSKVVGATGGSRKPRRRCRLYRMLSSDGNDANISDQNGPPKNNMTGDGFRTFVGGLCFLVWFWLLLSVVCHCCGYLRTPCCLNVYPRVKADRLRCFVWYCIAVSALEASRRRGGSEGHRIPC